MIFTRILFPRFAWECRGSSSSRQYLFKEGLVKLADEITEIRIVHYPPRTREYNPIEHRLFPYVTRACEGVVFKNVEVVRYLTEKTESKTGQELTVEIMEKVYQTGRTAFLITRQSCPSQASQFGQLII